VRRDRTVLRADHQRQVRAQTRQCAFERLQIPVRHHTERRRHMPRAAHEAAIKFDARRLQRRAGLPDQPFHHRAVAAAPGEQQRHHRQGDEQPGERREQMPRHAAQRQQCAIEADEAARGDRAFQAHLRQDRGPGRMAGGHRRAHIQHLQQQLQAPRHARQRQPPGRRRPGEAVAGQIGGDHGEVLRQQRRQGTPGMGGGAGAVDQQQHRPGAELLHMPGQAGGAHEAAVRAVRPVPALALPRRTQCGRRRGNPRARRSGQGGARRGHAAAARTASDSRTGSAFGRAR
jgi:hypothetical protein